MERPWLITFGVIVLAAAYPLVDQDAEKIPSPESYLTVEESDVRENGSKILRFEEMTESQKQVFIEELETDNKTLTPENVKLQDWIEKEYVNYQNSTYQVAVAQN